MELTNSNNQGGKPCVDNINLGKLLRERCPQAQVIEDQYIPEHLLSDFLGYEVGQADCYVQAHCTQDVVEVVKLCNQLQLPLIVRGAGTNLVGSTIPHGGIVLDMSALNRILELDTENQTLLVEPGVKLCDLQAYVEEKGLFYPPDPAEKKATIGGNISTNAGGMRAVKYGVTRDFVLALEVVTPQGELLTLGSPCLKDATGLNIKQLLIGAEGTLGVITKCLLRLIPKPESTKHLLLGFNNLHQAISSVNVLKQANLNPTAIEFMDRKVIAFGETFSNQQFPLPEAQAYLIVTFDGPSEQVDKNLKDCKAILQKLNDGSGLEVEDVSNANNQAATGSIKVQVLDLEDPVVSKNVWTIRAALAQAVQASGVWEPVDTVVPLKHIADFVGYIGELSQEQSIRIFAFGHAGDGNVHLCILKDDLDINHWPQKLQTVLSALYQKVYTLNGKVAAEHGVGQHKRHYFLEQVNPVELSLMRAVKQAIDPLNIFAPHNTFAE